MKDVYDGMVCYAVGVGGTYRHVLKSTQQFAVNDAEEHHFH